MLAAGIELHIRAERVKSSVAKIVITICEQKYDINVVHDMLMLYFRCLK